MLADAPTFVRPRDFNDPTCTLGRLRLRQQLVNVHGSAGVNEARMGGRAPLHPFSEGPAGAGWMVPSPGSQEVNLCFSKRLPFGAN